MLKINVIGNLTADVELRTKKGDDIPYAIMRLASDRRYRSKDGDKLTDFVSVKVRGNLAERCAEYLVKGDRIAAFGDFETITTPDENGNMRQSGFLIKASDVEFLTNKKREEAELQELLDTIDLDEEAPQADEVSEAA